MNEPFPVAGHQGYEYGGERSVMAVRAGFVPVLGWGFSPPPPGPERGPAGGLERPVIATPCAAQPGSWLIGNVGRRGGFRVAACPMGRTGQGGTAAYCALREILP